MTTEMTIRPFFWRATNLFPETEVVARTPEGTHRDGVRGDGIHRYTYREFGDRVPLNSGWR